MVPAIRTNHHGYGHGQSYGTGLLHFHGYLHFILVHFSTGLCLWIEIAPMRDVSATETAIIYGMEPLWGAGFAWFLLGERWGTLGWIGAALVLGGSLGVQIFGSSPPQEFTVAEDGNEKGDLRRLPTEHKL
ncbi:uncharacterized protein LOC110745472 isoform X4 [Prunus avium]|uniref:Uncharacterized protein LOC110745472 isoform X4 n=1 Tax=Prunus avium TaxID=42229 RepID=A0A6P5R8T0_PRUAV|nr:uncharacterized protein LOC110745472 isoform X4 [Prunus avium]